MIEEMAMQHERELSSMAAIVTQRRQGAFTDVLDTIFREKRLLGVLLAALVFGLGLYLIFAPRTYEAEMSILVKAGRADLAVSPIGGADRVENAGFESLFATEVQMLTSQELLRGVVAECGLRRKGDSPDDALARLKKALQVGPVLKSNLIHVTYTDTDAARAAKVLQTLADRYLEKYITVHSTPGSLTFFENQASEARVKLNEAQARMTEFQTRSETVALKDQKDLVLRKLLDLESALREAQAAARENDPRMETIRGQLTQAQTRITTQRREVSNQYSVERLNTLLVELQNRRTEMATKFRAEDRMVKQLDQQIADTRRALDSARGSTAIENTTDVNPLRQTLEAELAKAQTTASGLRGRIAALTRQMEESRARLMKLEMATADDQELARAAQLAEENYLLYAKKLEESRIADALDQQRIVNVQLVDQPQVPLQPNGRLRPAVIGLALLGTLGSLMIAFVWGNRRRVLNTPWEVESSVDAPLMATIPKASDSGAATKESAAAAKAGGNQ